MKNKDEDEEMWELLERADLFIGITAFLDIVFSVFLGIGFLTGFLFAAFCYSYMK